MRVVMLTLAAGPDGVLLPGREYERVDGAALVAAGAAVDVSLLGDAAEPSEVAADLEAASDVEHAVEPKARKARRR